MSLKAYDVKELDLTNPRRFSLSAENELIDGKQCSTYITAVKQSWLILLIAAVLPG